ncbi:unnamed protein product, partial [Effrenium voratum]
MRRLGVLLALAGVLAALSLGRRPQRAHNARACARPHVLKNGRPNWQGLLAGGGRSNPRKFGPPACFAFETCVDVAAAAAPAPPLDPAEGSEDEGLRLVNYDMDTESRGGMTAIGRGQARAEKAEVEAEEVGVLEALPLLEPWRRAMDEKDLLPVRLVGLTGRLLELEASWTWTGRELRAAAALKEGVGSSEAGRALVLSFGERRLVLASMLKDQGLQLESDGAVCGSFTYMKTCLLHAWEVLQGHGDPEEPDEQALDGLSELGWDRNSTLELLRLGLPETLQRLTFGNSFNTGLLGLSLPSGLQSLSLGHSFNRHLAPLPPGLTELTLGNSFNQRLQGRFPGLQSLQLGRGFNQTLEGLELPNLRSLSLGDAFDQPLVTLPSGLQSLSLGSRFNQCLEGLSLPNLQSLSFGDTFNQPLQGVTLPSLQSLAFGDSFDQNLQGLDLRNLQRLAFGDSCEQRLTGLSLPNLQSLSFGKSYQNLRDLPSPSLQHLKLFCGNLEDLSCLSQLQSLTLGDFWPQTSLPSSLQSLTLDGFNQSLEGLQLPGSLRHLTLGDGFNQRLQDVALPGSLQSLTLGNGFNRNLQGTALPSGLQSLSFGRDFNQRLWGLSLPCALQSLTFGFSFDQSLQRVALPGSLLRLTFGYCFDQSLQGMSLPENLQSLCFGDSFDQPLQGVPLPGSLQSLTFGKRFNQELQHITFPSSLQSLTLGRNFDQSLQGVTLPDSLLSLTLGHFFQTRLSGDGWPSGPVLRRISGGGVAAGVEAVGGGEAWREMIRSYDKFSVGADAELPNLPPPALPAGRGSGLMWLGQTKELSQEELQKMVTPPEVPRPSRSHDFVLCANIAGTLGSALQALKAFLTIARRLQERGWRVRVVFPALGTHEFDDLPLSTRNGTSLANMLDTTPLRQLLDIEE